MYVKRHAPVLIECFAVYNKLAMTKPPTLLILAVLAAGHGLVSLLGALFLDDVPPLLRMSSVLVGVLLVAGAGMLAAGRGIAIALLWLSALVYFLAIVGPAFHRHGSAAFAVLMDAFYWSFGFRVFLAVAAHVLLARRRALLAIIQRLR